MTRDLRAIFTAADEAAAAAVLEAFAGQREARYPAITKLWRGRPRAPWIEVRIIEPGTRVAL
jgi:transposase-like protein